jgi:acetyl esterase
MTAINPAQNPKVEHRIREFLKSLNSGGGAPIETMHQTAEMLKNT